MVSKDLGRVGVVVCSKVRSGKARSVSCVEPSGGWVNRNLCFIDVEVKDVPKFCLAPDYIVIVT